MSLLFLPLQILLIVLDFLSSLVFDTKWIQALKKLLFGSEPSMKSVALNNDPSNRTFEGFEEKRIETPSTGAKTLYEIAKNTFEKHGEHVGMKKRQFLGMEGPKKPKFGKELIEYTWKEVGEKAHRFGAALVGHGMCAAPETTTLEKNTSKPCRMAIFENTCAEWMIACLGAFSQSITVTTVYATLVRWAGRQSNGMHSAFNCASRSDH